MHSLKNLRRDQQMNIRFTTAEIAELERIAEIEDRDRSYLVAFFTRWGIEQYYLAGSLTVLRSTKITAAQQLRLTGEVESEARDRLKVREEARIHNEHRSVADEVASRGKKKDKIANR